VSVTPGPHCRWALQRAVRGSLELGGYRQRRYDVTPTPEVHPERQTGAAIRWFRGGAELERGAAGDAVAHRLGFRPCAQRPKTILQPSTGRPRRPGESSTGMRQGEFARFDHSGGTGSASASTEENPAMRRHGSVPPFCLLRGPAPPVQILHPAGPAHVRWRSPASRCPARRHGRLVALSGRAYRITGRTASCTSRGQCISSSTTQEERLSAEPSQDFRSALADAQMGDTNAAGDTLSDEEKKAQEELAAQMSGLAER